MKRDEVLRCLVDHRVDLDRYGVRSLALFGSAARDEAGPDSDIDLLVEFSRPVGLFTFIGLQLQLEQWLGRPVDLVTPDALSTSMRAAIQREAIDAA